MTTAATPCCSFPATHLRGRGHDLVGYRTHNGWRYHAKPTLTESTPIERLITPGGLVLERTDAMAPCVASRGLFISCPTTIRWRYRSAAGCVHNICNSHAHMASYVRCPSCERSRHPGSTGG